MPRSDAAEAQVRAARPDVSTWLLANAGSGKTRVLTDRVARLLLKEVEPQRILCLTYTKAAASEMQNRLFQTLGGWAMKPDDGLRKALSELGEERMDADHLARARRLFARAIETPGGLRIQTIHSFCATLLRRFPLEAGVPPRFGELDDRSARLMRQEILEEMSDGPQREIVADLAREFSGEDMPGLIEQIIGQREVFRLSSDDSQPFDLASAERELVEAVTRGMRDWFGTLLATLAKGKTNDLRALKKLEAVNLDAADLDLLARLEGVFLSGADATEPFAAKVGSFPTKDTRPLLGQAEHWLNETMRRVEAARDQRIALQAARKTRALNRFGQAFLPLYEARKAQGAWLDFDDLIAKATELVTDPSVAAWVLYRLDGGIDHVLVDEAQDTSPGQWRVIELLTAEFTAGQGARNEARTLFVVGDQKQSIYSFQGADVAGFDAKREAFHKRFQAANLPFQRLELTHSFRSSPAILHFVDAALADRSTRALGPEIRHLAFHPQLPGRVDLWPLVEPGAKAEERRFEDPVDLISSEHHFARLAGQIAETIRAMLEGGEMIHSREGPRRVHAGDFLILVQRRSPLFSEIIRACKKAGLPIAGADRLKLSAELAVKDLLGLLAFLDVPDDNLSLAAVLRSPLCGLTEDDLYRLAHGREGTLWEALQAAQQKHLAAHALLADMRAQVDFLRPFEMLERILIRHDGRRRLVARLGSEAEDAIDELLNQALAYERGNVPSLTGFLIWLEADSIQVKRQAEASGQRIRVMTVHGAKGLEAEIVFLPDTSDRRASDNHHFLVSPEGAAVWKTRTEDSTAAIQALKQQKAEREAEERLRLLYVAMTRARTWLIVAGAGEVKQPDSWYTIAAEAMAKVGGKPFAAGQRFETGAWPTDAAPKGPAPEPLPDLPGWALRAVPQALPKPAVLTPSSLGGAKALAGEATSDTDQDRATEFGSAVHALLERLPGKDKGLWPQLASHLFADASLRAAALAEAEAVLADPDLAHLFVPSALSEVPLSGVEDDRALYGLVDRLILQPDRVLAVDFKTNALVPSRAEDIPEGILRQLAAYQRMLARLYPKLAVSVAILWTKTRGLMEVDPEIVRAAWQRATRDWGNGP